jgi:acyl-CoA reductase-like NAD-dependent aldehyde dehydrogenase
VPTPEEAIEPASDTEFGLSARTVIAAGTVTDDHTETSRFVAVVDFGVPKANETTTGVELHVPFSGMNVSFSAETYRERGEVGRTTSPARPSTIVAESRNIRNPTHWPARWSWMVTLHERCW